MSSKSFQNASKLNGIRGGTVSSIVQGAMTLFSSTDKTVYLGPNESVVITHSSAPILSVQKH